MPGFGRNKPDGMSEFSTSPIRIICFCVYRVTVLAAMWQNKQYGFFTAKPDGFTAILSTI